MPAVFDSLVQNQGLTPHVAWRVAFVVPGICITAVALALLLCPNTPTGKWSGRHLVVQHNLVDHGINATIVDAPAGVMDKKSESSSSTSPAATDEKLHTMPLAIGRNRTTAKQSSQSKKCSHSPRRGRTEALI
jgi:MFS transporter, NNP family, nitrate/nitrite transporter